MQENVVVASQRHIATVLDKRVEAAQELVHEKREFKVGELVLSFRHGGSKLHEVSAHHMSTLPRLWVWTKGSS
jgi:hypothetical protein